MKKQVYFDKKKGLVKMMSVNASNHAPNVNHKEFELTPQEVKDLQNPNYDRRVVNGKIVIEKGDEETPEEIIEQIKNVKSWLGFKIILIKIIRKINNI